MLTRDKLQPIFNDAGFYIGPVSELPDAVKSGPSRDITSKTRWYVAYLNPPRFGQAFPTLFHAAVVVHNYILDQRVEYTPEWSLCPAAHELYSNRMLGVLAALRDLLAEEEPTKYQALLDQKSEKGAR